MYSIRSYSARSGYVAKYSSTNQNSQHDQAQNFFFGIQPPKYNLWWTLVVGRFFYCSPTRLLTTLRNLVIVLLYNLMYNHGPVYNETEKLTRKMAEITFFSFIFFLLQRRSVAAAPCAAIRRAQMSAWPSAAWCGVMAAPANLSFPLLRCLECNSKSYIHCRRAVSLMSKELDRIQAGAKQLLHELHVVPITVARW